MWPELGMAFIAGFCVGIVIALSIAAHDMQQQTMALRAAIERAEAARYPQEVTDWTW